LELTKIGFSFSFLKRCKSIWVHGKSLPKLLANMAKFIKIVAGLFLTKGFNAFSRYWVVSNVSYCAFWKLYSSWKVVHPKI
jgi:hypothetical protein